MTDFLDRVPGDVRAALGDITSRCVGCGFCLQACPTYRVSAVESASPRGRIALMDALLEGELEANGASLAHLDACLGCRGCEPACPSGVDYGALLEGGRAALRSARLQPARGAAGFAERVLLSLIGSPRALRWALVAGALARRLGLARLLGALLPRSMGAMLALAASPDGPRYQALDVGPLAGPPVALFLGCVQRALFPGVHRDTAELLVASGFRVGHPEGQGCCGALPLHVGDAPRARAYARANVVAFDRVLERAPDTLIVVNAAGCGSALKEYGALFADDPELGPAAARVAAAVRDWSEVVIGEQAGGEGRRVAYQDACHLAHAQGIRTEPRALLAGAPGLQAVELDDEGLCCGSAGVYNITHPAMAGELARLKCAAIERADVELVASCNPGCLLHLRAALEERPGSVKVAHLASIVADARRGAARVGRGA